jgi:8-oxo-dGTP pyrophosphatase MutT (NUDIX family)
MGERVVAGVCYREGELGLELLLVRTSDGERWTFPKGHVEPYESPAEAVVREVAEEAGVIGVAEAEPFATYRYAFGTGRHDRSGEHGVDAFLVRVTPPEQAPVGAEADRSPTWLRLDEAARRLAEARAPFYAREHEQVVTLARRVLEDERPPLTAG